MSALLRIGMGALLVCACCLAGCASSDDGGDAAATAPASETASPEQTAADVGDMSQNAEASASQGSTSGSPQREEDKVSEGAASAVTATIGGVPFSIELADNDTAAAFAQLLPLQAEMSELNGNEKYVYLDESLPSHPTNPGTIEAGDVMLYGDNCLVIFYESHPTSYSYTRIGTIADAAGVAAAVGTGSVSVSFTLE